MKEKKEPTELTHTHYALIGSLIAKDWGKGHSCTLHELVKNLNCEYSILSVLCYQAELLEKILKKLPSKTKSKI